MWANHIAALDLHHQEMAIDSPPPETMIHLFQHAPENIDQRVSAFRRGTEIATAVIGTALGDIAWIEQETTTLRNLILELVPRVQTLTVRLNSFKRSMEAQNIVVMASRTALATEELPSSAVTIGRITDQIDVDHVDDNDHMD